jgi:CHASE3 domain sensor protein/GAF domain-containing protein
VSTGGRPSAAAPAPEARLGGGLTGRMLLASGLLLLILAAAFTVLLVAVADLRESSRAAHDSEEVLATANELERLVIDLETGVRGFVLTREEQFLQPWHTARRSLPARAATLERLSAGDPEQARTARQITQAANSYVEQYAAPLINAARRGDPAARGVAATAEGKRRVDAMRTAFDAFIGTERRLAQARQQRADGAARRAVLAVLGGLAASMLLVLVFAGYLTHAIVQPVRRAARMAVRLAGGDLSTRMPAISVAEVGQLERSFNQMAGSLERNRDELAELAAEQAALRRVATLVARGVSPPQVFSAVAQEVAQRLGAEVAKVLRYEPDGTATVVGGWSVPGIDIPIGTRLTVEGQGVAVSVLHTARPARAERLEGPAGSVAACFHSLGVHSTVGSPILVEGRLWGVAIAGSTHPDPLPAGSEDRILAFTELVATAIANAEARAGLRRIAEEQAALRRVATLVARGVAPDLVLAAVAEEARELLGADLTTIFRFEPDGTASLMGGRGWRPGDMELGARWRPEPPSVVASVLATGRPARSDDYSPTSPSLPEVVRREGIRSGVASPILVEGRRWGAIVVSSRSGPLPADTEQRMVDFTEIVATAIANAESRAELAASRARVVAAAAGARPARRGPAAARLAGASPAWGRDGDSPGDARGARGTRRGRVGAR